MFVDANVEQSPFTINTDSSIAPFAPTSFQPELLSDGLRVYIEGRSDSGGLVKFVRPFLENEFKGNFTRKLTISPDDAVSKYCGAIEFDLRVTFANGRTYPLDMQWNVQTGQFQIATGVAEGKIAWNDTGIIFKLPANVASVIKVTAAIDDVNGTCSILTASCNGVNGSIPTILQNQLAFSLGWEPGTVVYQDQVDVADSALDGGAFEVTYSEDSLAYIGS